MSFYTSTQDYIEKNIAPGLGDVELTDEQALEVAQRMTCYGPGYEEIECEGGVRYNYFSALYERTDRDFWDVVATVLGDN